MQPMRVLTAHGNHSAVRIRSTERASKRTFSALIGSPQQCAAPHKYQYMGLSKYVPKYVPPNPRLSKCACTCTCSSLNLQSRRAFTSGSDEGGSDVKIKPVFVAIPNPIKIVRNKIFFWLIRSYFDPDFTIEDFTRGATQALVTISQQMAEGALQNLEGLLSPKLLRELKNTFRNFDAKEMSSLSLDTEDILHSFPHDITIHYDDKGGKFLFILMKFWCHSVHSGSSDPEVKGFRIGRPPPGVSQEQFDTLGSVFSCTYEFHRNISPDANSRWIVTYMQHGQVINTETKGLPEEE